MKIKIAILWTAAFVIAMLAAYFSAVTDRDFPISGTTGIEGKKLSYRFEKKARTGDTLTLILRNDVDSISAVMEVLSPTQEKIPFRLLDKGMTLRADYRLPRVPEEVVYKVFVTHKSAIIQLPDDGLPLTTQCLGKVPAQILQVYYFTLYFGLLLAVRIGIEFFTDGKKIKKLALFTTILFNLFGFFVIPVMRMFEQNMIDRTIAQPGELFSLTAFLPGILWILVTIVLFTTKKNKPVALGAAVITLLLVALIHF